MDEKQDTTKGILAEMRGLVKPGETLENTYEMLNGLAERYEAAHKREVGNVAKMREALKAVRMFLDGYTVNNLELRRMVDAALAAPPRNCDVGTVVEQDECFEAFCKRYFRDDAPCSESCPCRLWGLLGGTCSIRWAQMPYDEGGAK